ncbi:MAG: O-acetylserine sulfhydrylase [Alphaproteobacteria bacterium MarineAlpha6_Bin2]|nr:MAG: O-acetylserine sulfhydrylase [Alphaproteobacteria bacterium MarineAlpha6_Bin2]
MKKFKTFRNQIYESILETIGNTPMVRVPKISKKYNCLGDLVCKLEFFNPTSSVKDRIGLSMIEDAEKKKLINKETIVVEPTSGNTGIGLAFICAAKGYKLILTMPESMSIERKRMLVLLGAKLILTPAKDGMKGAIAKAKEILKKNKNSFMPQQFNNASNPQIHKTTTAIEILNDTKGKLDAIVMGVGTGGTITGVAEVLKKKNKKIKIIAVEPEDSPILSGGIPGPHKIQGIGAGFIPKVLNKKWIDEIIQIANETAFSTARIAAKIEGLPVGISSGAALAAGIEVACRKEMKNKRIVVIIPSFAERYLSTELFNSSIN